MAKRSASKSSAPAPGPEHRVVLLTGKELFLHSEHTERVRESLRSAHGDVDVVRFDGTTVEPAAVLDECRTFGLMQQHKLVVVDQADQFVKETHRPMVERYVTSPSDAATLVLRAETWHKGKLDGMIEKCGIIVRCDAVTAGEASRWAVARCAQEHGATLEPEAAQLLVERLGTDLGRLDSEMAKLALNAMTPAGKPGKVTAALVGELVGRSREEEVWVIQSALLSRDPAVAIGAVRDAIEVSRHPTVLVSWACVDLARKVHGAAQGLASGARPFDLVKALRLWGSSQEAVLSAARRVAPGRAAALLRDAIRADVRQKTGVGEPQRILEALALRFAGM